MWLQSFIDQTVKHLTFTFGKIAKLKTLKITNYVKKYVTALRTANLTNILLWDCYYGYIDVWAAFLPL